MKFYRQRNQRGSSIVETAAGLILLIPIVLFLVDVAAMVVCQTENDKIAKACARAAAEFPTGQGDGAAQTVWTNQKESTLLHKVACTAVSPVPAGMVSYKTDVQCNLPVPVPLLGNKTVNFSSIATEPIVGELAIPGS
ncbi:MAG TPA: hypothetical protein V6C76_08195 [Drouetiella sp.]